MLDPTYYSRRQKKRKDSIRFFAIGTAVLVVFAAYAVARRFFDLPGWPMMFGLIGVPIGLFCFYRVVYINTHE